MRFLLLHQNFPGQFVHLAPALAARDHHVVACSLSVKKRGVWQGVELFPYRLNQTQYSSHPLANEFQTKILRAEGCGRVLLQIAAEGFVPDCIIAHPGWGESLFVKEIWPDTKLAIYCEYYYNPAGVDVGFDPELSNLSLERKLRARLKTPICC